VMETFGLTLTDPVDEKVVQGLSRAGLDWGKAADLSLE